MPYDSNGNHSLPSGYLAVTGQTIQASQHNPPLEDLSASLSQTLLRSGASPLSGNLNAAGFKITNAAAGTAPGDYVNKEQLDEVAGDIPDVATKLDVLQPYANVASAATTDIGAAASQNVMITGTTTITSFGTVAAGTVRDVVFAGALTLTHNATSLILPYGANITTVAGETLRAVSLGTGKWRVTEYQKSTFPNPTLTAGAGLTSTGSLAAGTMEIALDIYTGSSSSQTTFPIGHVVQLFVGSNIARNGIVVPAINGSDTSGYVVSSFPDAGASLSGTYRVRGGAENNQNDTYIAVRVL